MLSDDGFHFTHHITHPLISDIKHVLSFIHIMNGINSSMHDMAPVHSSDPLQTVTAEHVNTGKMQEELPLQHQHKMTPLVLLCYLAPKPTTTLAYRAAAFSEPFF